MPDAPSDPYAEGQGTPLSNNTLQRLWRLVLGAFGFTPKLILWVNTWMLQHPSRRAHFLPNVFCCASDTPDNVSQMRMRVNVT